MGTIRIGVIGCGGIAGHHLKVLKGETVSGEDVTVTAFCDVDIDAAKSRRAEFGEGGELVTADYIELLDSGAVDAALIATPHPHHPEATIAAFERGIHVLVEKPVAVTVGDARAMNAAREKSGCIYTIHFQRRFDPRYRWVKRWIDSGALGRLLKVNVTWTDWYRPQKYYDRGTWRGTWGGEGGGVLMNQCPHDLDLFTWWLGLPETVEAKMWLGRYHDIEVEDEVAATLVFEGGGIGMMNASTCDAPGVTRWDILGDEGAILIAGDDLKVLKRAENFATYTQNSTEFFGVPPADQIEPDLSDLDYPTGSEGVWVNFIRAIRGEEELLLDGREGASSLELANAIVASAFLAKPVELPLDAGLYDGVLADLRAGKTGAAVTRE